MATKRVHEMAKELGLKNKELIEKLKKLGFEVASHSSSLEEVEAEAVMARLRGGEEPEKVKKPSPSGGAGVVRRRRKVSRGETEVVTETRIVPGGEARTEEVLRTTERAAAEEVEKAPPAEAPAISEAQSEAELEEKVEARVEEEIDGGAPSEELPGQDADGDLSEAEEKPAEMASAEEADRDETAVADAEAAAAEVEARDGEARPDANGHAVAKEEKQAEREEKEAPRLKEPTSTQAVVVKRAAIPIKPKVPPAARGGEGKPSDRRIGPIKEYQVVTDVQGRDRELVDVSRDKAGKKKPSPGGARRAKETYSKTELLSLARERAFIPLRGRKRRPTKKGKKTELTQAAAHKRVVKVEESIQVSDLAKQMGVKLVDVIRKLMQMGSPATANQSIDLDTASLVAQEFDYEVKKVGVGLEDLLGKPEKEIEGQPRPPVVTVMGHVDHGKTSLLDYIRKTKVADGEAGGITQHIGAYSVKVGDGTVTFLDTPGHEAFTAMRARGAQVTDLVILVVAADDSIMPQTVEAINHAKASGVPLVVAVNKCDLPQANPDRVRQGLTEHELVPEEWGGDIIVVDVSAKTGEGIDKLLEMTLLQAELMDLRAPVDNSASGVVVEAKVEKGRGPVATVLVKEGTLSRGEIIFTGQNYGKIRAMLDYTGKNVKQATPSMPVEVLGLNGVPSAGEQFHVVKDEKAARELAERNSQKVRMKDMAGSARKKATLEDLFSQMKEGERKDLALVVKADVQGSVEAVIGALEKLSGPKVKLMFLHHGVGAISESDVMLAAASNAIIIGFNVLPDGKAKRLATHEGVQIRTYEVIYDAVNDVKSAMEGLLEPIRKEHDVGKAEVLDVFRISGKGVVAGCKVTQGKIARGLNIRVKREGEKVFDSKVDGLKRFKDDVKEVTSGFECGVSIGGFNAVKQGDILEIYEVEEIRQTL